MESSSSNSEERELQQMLLEEKQLHSKCMASFKELKSHLGNLPMFSEVKNTRPFEIAFRILFRKDHQTFREKILVIEGEALDASLVIEGASLEARLVTKGAALETSLVNEGITLYASLVAKQSTVDSGTSRLGNENKSSNNESSSSGNDADANIGPSHDSDTVSEVHHDIFKNMFVQGIQNHEQPESIPDTYVVNENNSDIISEIPNMDQDKESGEKKILFGNETSNFETKIKELEMILAQQTKDFENAKVNFSKKMDRHELALEQSQQGAGDDVLVNIEGVEECNRNVRIKGLKKEALHTLRQKPCQYICYQNHKDDCWY
ncbi:hypothetical protein Tco_0817109 [Tanacetum coccineum]